MLKSKGQKNRFLIGALSHASCLVLAFGALAFTPVGQYAVAQTTTSSRTSSWRPQDKWIIENTPDVDIGDANADSVSAMKRVIHAARLRDGRIAVVDLASKQVKLFSLAGKYLRSIGRAGQGPGEFSAPMWVGVLAADSLIVADPGGGLKFSVFSPAGDFVRTIRVPVKFSSADVLGSFSDRSVLVRRNLSGTRVEGIFTRSYGVFFRLSLDDGRMLDSIGVFPNQTGTRNGLPYVWGPWAQQTTGESSFYFGAGEKFEIAQFTRAGALIRTIRLDRTGRAPTQAEIDEWRAPRIASSAARSNPAILRRYSTTQFASKLPPHFALVADTPGNLWVQQYVPRIGFGKNWTIFSPVGSYLGDIVLPAELRIMEVGADFLLGLWQDADDVTHVRQYRIRKP